MWCNQTCKEYAARILKMLLIWIQGGLRHLSTCFDTQEDTTHTKMDQQHKESRKCAMFLCTYCKKEKA